MDRLERARQYLAIAESQDSKREAYLKAADEIIAAQKEGWGVRAIAREIGKSESWVRQLLEWATNAQDHTHLPFGGPENTERSHRSVAKNYLAKRDPEAVQEIIRELPAKRRAQIAQTILTDSATVRTVLSDPKVAASVGREEIRRNNEIQSRARAINPERTARHDNARALQTVTDHIYRAAGEIALALRDIAEIKVSSTQRELMLVAIADAELRLGWLRSFLETGDRSFDDALTKLLEGA